MTQVQAPAMPAPEGIAPAREGADRPSMGLVGRLVILTAVFSLLLVLGATEISLSWSARSRIEDFRDDAVSLSTTLAALLSGVAPTGDSLQLTEALDEWSGRRLGPSRRAWIYVANGGNLRPVASSDSVPRPPDDSDYNALARNATVTFLRGGHDPGWQVAAPLGAAGRPYGVLDIHVSTKRLEEWSRVERQRAYLAAFVAALLVALGVALLTRKWVAYPLRALGHAMAGAHGGPEGAPEAPLLGPHEFRALARRYNELRKALVERERENQARAALLALQERTRGLDRLALMQETAAEFAHEIGTPLNTVSGHLQLLRDDLQAAGQTGMVERVRLLLGQLDRVTGIVRAGLDHRRWPQSYVHRADLHIIAEQLLKFMEPSFNDARIRTRLERRGARPAVAVCDPAQVEQIVLNLLKNAVEALGPGGRITVTTGVSGDQAYGVSGDQAYVEVADDGPGLAPEAEATLFRPFATTKGAAGTGLGLAVSRRLARGMAGDLTHLPTDRGTHWRLALPTAESA